MRTHLKIIFLLLFGLSLSQCVSIKKRKSRNRPYQYGWYPKKYQETIDNFEKYSVPLGCKPGETIASIGAGNGRQEVQVACFVEDITWYLEEIDSLKLYQFDKVLAHHEKLKGSSIDADFKLIMGTETSTKLPKGIFDRIIMVIVFHEISNRAPIMSEIQELLKTNGELVIMETMAKEPGEQHPNCKHMKLYEPEFLKEMEEYGYRLKNYQIGETFSQLVFYTFTPDLD